MATRYKPPIPEKPYFPALGWNSEAGLSIKSEECTDTNNLRFSKKDLFTRDGYRSFAENNVGVLLETYLFKKADGSNQTFGFSANNVFRYNSGNNRWQYGKSFELFEDCEAITGFGSDIGTPATSLTRFYGNYGMTVQASADIADTEVIFDQSGTDILDWGATTNTHIAFWYLHNSATDIAVKVKFYSDESKTTLIESFDVTLSANTRGEFQEAVCDIKEASYANVKSWEIVSDGGETVATTLDFYIDNICGITRLANGVTFWHCTRFVDDTVGETVVAAGSSPPQIDAAEDDGGTRALLQYDTTNSYFKTLTTYHVLAIGDEDTGETCPAAAGIVTGTNLAHKEGDADFQEIYKGTFSLYTLEYGTLATSSSVTSDVNTGTANGHVLIPVDTTKIKGGDDSWMEKDGTDWSVEFLTDEYDGLKIYVQYSYKETSDIKPRFVWNFHNRLLVGSTFSGSTYYPWRMHWGAAGKIDFFTYADYADLVDNDVSPITGGDLLGDALTVYKAQSITRGSFIGGTSVFLFSTVWMEGTWAGRTVVSFRNRHYLLSNDDVVMWDGMAMRSISRSVNVQDSPHRVRDHIFTNTNQGKIRKCFGSFFPAYKEYWLWTVGSGADYPTQVYVYNILNDVWYYFTMPACTSAGDGFVDGNPTIDDLIGTINDQNWRLDSASTEGLLNATIITPASGMSAGVLDDTIATDGGYWQGDETWVAGAVIDWELITRDFIYGDVPQQDRTQRIDIEALGTDFLMAYSSKYITNTAAFLFSTTITLTAEFEELHYFPDAVGEHIRFSLTGDDPFRFRWLQPYAVIEELSNE